ARLGCRRIAFDLAADATPQVDLPVQARTGAELADAARARIDHGALDGAAAATAAAALGVAGAARDRRIESGRILAHQRARLAIGRLRLHQRLVGDVDLRSQPVERRIA